MSTKRAAPNVRQRAIRAAVEDQGFAGVQELSDRLGVSTVTVRADLAALEANGEARRVRGGAVPAPRLRPERPFEQVREEAGPAKHVIARRAAQEIHNGDTVLLDVGTTTTAIARQLVRCTELSALTVFTNSLTIALELERAAERVQTVVTGGTLRPLQHSLVDPLATVLLDGINADLAFIGCNGVHPQAGFTNVNLPEVTVKQAFLQAAQRRVVVADGSKVGEVQLVRICRLDEIDLLATDDTADSEVIAELRANGLDVNVENGPAA